MPDRIDNSHLGSALGLFFLLLLNAIAAELVLVVIREVLKRLGLSITPITWARLLTHAAAALFSLALALCFLLLLGLGWEPRWSSALKLFCLVGVTLFFWLRARADLRALIERR